MQDYIFDEEPGFWRIIKLRPFRKTEGVSFDILPMRALPKVDGIDRVIHEGRAISPGAVGDIERPWYVHRFQEDNLLVLHGERSVEIYSAAYKRVESFVVTADSIVHNGKLAYEGSAMVVWPRDVFHRIVSGDTGSISINFAVRHEGFDINTAFDVYDLDTRTGEHRVIREGRLDQFPS